MNKNQQEFKDFDKNGKDRKWRGQTRRERNGGRAPAHMTPHLGAECQF